MDAQTWAQIAEWTRLADSNRDVDSHFVSTVDDCQPCGYSCYSGISGASLCPADQHGVGVLTAMEPVMFSSSRVCGLGEPLARRRLLTPVAESPPSLHEATPVASSYACRTTNPHAWPAALSSPARVHELEAMLERAEMQRQRLQMQQVETGLSRTQEMEELYRMLQDLALQNSELVSSVEEQRRESQDQVARLCSHVEELEQSNHELRARPRETQREPNSPQRLPRPQASVPMGTEHSLPRRGDSQEVQSADWDMGNTILLESPDSAILATASQSPTMGQLLQQNALLESELLTLQTLQASSAGGDAAAREAATLLVERSTLLEKQVSELREALDDRPSHEDAAAARRAASEILGRNQDLEEEVLRLQAFLSEGAGHGQQLLLDRITELQQQALEQRVLVEAGKSQQLARAADLERQVEAFQQALEARTVADNAELELELQRNSELERHLDSAQRELEVCTKSGGAARDRVLALERQLKGLQDSGDAAAELQSCNEGLQRRLEELQMQLESQRCLSAGSEMSVQRLELQLGEMRRNAEHAATDRAGLEAALQSKLQDEQHAEELSSENSSLRTALEASQERSEQIDELMGENESLLAVLGSQQTVLDSQKASVQALNRRRLELERFLALAERDLANSPDLAAELAAAQSSIRDLQAELAQTRPQAAKFRLACRDNRASLDVDQVQVHGAEEMQIQKQLSEMRRASPGHAQDALVDDLEERLEAQRQQNHRLRAIVEKQGSSKQLAQDKVELEATVARLREQLEEQDQGDAKSLRRQVKELRANLGVWKRKASEAEAKRPVSTLHGEQPEVVDSDSCKLEMEDPLRTFTKPRSRLGLW